MAAPMRDGVMLLGDHYFVAGLEDAPVILMRSPYGRSGPFGVTAEIFAERGFQVFIQSCRGAFGSGGAFDPLRQEHEDGLDTLSWILGQPWCSEQLFTFGSSYAGFTQWAIAKQAGKRIDGMSLQVTLSNFMDQTLAFGGFSQAGSLEWTSFVNALSSPGPLWLKMLAPRKNLRKVHMHLPVRELDRLAVGKTVTWWRDWVDHDDPNDPWWDKINHSKTVGDIETPAIMVGGWRDIFLPWQMKDFEAMQARGRNVWLTVGPWSHADMRGLGECLKKSLSFFSALAEGAPPLQTQDRVRLFVMGADEWREFPSWPPLNSRRQPLFLQPGRKLSSSEPTIAGAPTTFTFDPADPTPAVHGPTLMGGAKTPDMSALERRKDTVSFTSEPLSADLEIIGPVEAELYVRSDCPHTDFYICLCDVDRKDRPIQVCDGYLRLRSNDPPDDLDGIRKIVIECWPTAYRFKRGRRLRIIVASGAHPRYARNLGTGEPLATATCMTPQHQAVFHDAMHPSALRLTTTAPEIPLRELQNENVALGDQRAS